MLVSLVPIRLPRPGRAWSCLVVPGRAWSCPVMPDRLQLEVKVPGGGAAFRGATVSVDVMSMKTDA